MLALPLHGSVPDLYHGKYVASLFASGEQGVWYDPSDLSTLFQDAYGTKPVTAVSQPVGLILDRRYGAMRGDELFTSPASYLGTLNSGWTFENGAFRAITPQTYSYPTIGGNASSFTYATPLTVGKTYEIIFTVNATSGTCGANVGTYNVASPGFRSSGTHRVIQKSEKSSGIQIQAGSNFVGTIAINSVREIPGNHATQSTTTSRPTLSARVNLLAKSEDFSPGTWNMAYSALTTNVTPAPDGTFTADKFSPNAGVTFNNKIATTGFWYSAYPFISQPAAVTAGAYVYRLRVKAAGFDAVQLRVAEANTLTGANQSVAAVNLNTGVIAGIAQTGNLTNTSASCIRSEEGWCDIRLSFTSGAAQTLYFGIWVQNTTQTTGDGVNGLDLWGADLRPANQAHLPYQRVNTSTDYDTVGFPYYLSFDGVDDYLSTGSIDFTATDRMTVFAGVRKLSDAAGGVLLELSADRNTNNSTFSMSAPDGGGNQYVFASRGTIDGALAVVSPYTYPTPHQAVLTGIGNISGDQSILRVNGVQAAQSVGDQGTGNFGNYPLYIGRRGGTQIPFNGRLYGLIVRGAQTDDAHLTHAEKYLAHKSGVTL